MHEIFFIQLTESEKIEIPKLPIAVKHDNDIVAYSSSVRNHISSLCDFCELYAVYHLLFLFFIIPECIAL